MGMGYEVPAAKRRRVIVDSDAACEADDPFAIVHALLSKKLEVRAVLAEHFAQEGSAARSLDEIRTILRLMESPIPALMGEVGPLSQIAPDSLSRAAAFIVEEARRHDDMPLYILCLGALTNLACALRSAPDIARRMTVIWIGGHGLDIEKPEHREFNSGNDVAAVNLVVESGIEFWQVPNSVYGTMHIGIAEIQRRVGPRGAIGRHLFENLARYNESPLASWTAGESWSLGDSPAVGLALEPNCGGFAHRPAPLVLDDTSYGSAAGRPLIRVYQSINSRFIIEDFISKLELRYPD